MQPRLSSPKSLFGLSDQPPGGPLLRHHDSNITSPNHPKPSRRCLPFRRPQSKMQAMHDPPIAAPRVASCRCSSVVPRCVGRTAAEQSRRRSQAFPILAETPCLVSRPHPISSLSPRPLPPRLHKAPPTSSSPFTPAVLARPRQQPLAPGIFLETALLASQSGQCPNSVKTYPNYQYHRQTLA